MVEMTLLKTYLTPAMGDGKRYFVMSYQAINWNDTEWTVSDADTNPIFGSAFSTIFIEGVSMSVSAAAAAIAFPYNVLQMGGHITLRFDRWVTADLYDTHITFVRMGIPKAAIISPYAAAPQWFWSRFISNYAATDDGHMKIWGWIDSEPDPAFPTPVSLESYRWPLTRKP
jgi:hypothetical protein